MQSVLGYLRLGVGGLFLEQQVYRQQREAPDGLKRGFILVATVGLLVGLATLIGQITETLASPDDEAILRTVREGLVEMPWYQDLREIDPGFEAQFERQFDQVVQILQLIEGGGILRQVITFIFSPFLYLLGWLIFGLFAHVIARALGGRGTLAQTLGCTALASGVHLLNLVQIVPYAQVAGVTLLGLIANYVALREAHELVPGRAFWATVSGPLLLIVVMAGVGCIFFSTIVSFLSGQGGA